MSTGPKRIGKYELQERLGRGGMGEVWKALDTQLQRHVAIKLIRAELQSDPHFIMRFQREAQVVASLHHPNIIKIFDFQTSQSPEMDNTIYMVMDYVEGQTLREYIRSTARIGKFPSAADIVHLFVPISMAIDYAHNKGMIHRDIKPANILLDKRLSNAKLRPGSDNSIGEPILTDFGIAKLAGSATNTLLSWWLGTPPYSSPEQARGLPGNNYSDLYALGIILYEMCTGVLPFNGDNPAAILMQHIHATPTPPALINPNIPPALTMVILRSIAKDPADRFPNATSMAMALCEALDMPISENLRQAVQSLEGFDEPTERTPRKSSQPMMAISPETVQSSLTPSLPSVPPGGGQTISPVVSVPGVPPIVPPVSNTPVLSSSPLPMQSISRSFTQGTVGGENLEQHMERLHQPMEERDVLLYASQVLEILDACGRQTPPIVHGAIQPTNILIGTRDRRAHLVGFGTVLQDRTRDTQERLMQSPQFLGYIPPEQLRGDPDPRSDLYALAATMHYLLTKRNPRNYPPFVYPPVRTLNPQLSPDVESVLTHALINDITLRYQSAAEMKRAIDTILLRYYGIPSQPFPEPQTIRLTPTNEQSSPNQLAHISAKPLRPVWPQWFRAKQGEKRIYKVLLAVLAILVIAGGLSWFLLTYRGTPSHEQTKTVAQTPTLVPPTDIGVIKAPDGEYIGISDGTFAFDTQRPGGDLKTQAAKYLKAKDFGSADSLWQQAAMKDTNDAETLIYMENRYILDAGDPYITIVVGTTLSGNPNSIAVGREATQAAYVAQKEYNMASMLPGHTKVRLLIANSGGVATYTTTVAQQIAQLAQKDKTIVGVMGWTSTATTLNAIGVLSPAKIPMMANSGADVLTGRSSYFFRVVLPASIQGRIGATYAEQSLNAKTAAVFVDEKNNFVLGLANGFTKRFTDDGNTIVATENYTVGQSKPLPSLLQDALSKHPDLIYFAGYPGDMEGILSNLQPSDPIVLGGSSLYQLGGYSQAARQGLGHLRFTAYSYPDQWDILGLADQKPAFFADYKADFDPNYVHHDDPYGYNRPDGTTMELYDAISVLLYGCSIALADKSTITGSDLQHALTQVTGNQAFQGVTSQISFGSDSNPTDRAILLICVYQGQFLKMDGIYGRFLVGEADRAQIFTPSACS
jgi:serine/threonine protein kinase/ABC-type branched-subunit amino acid transport system substrate-binding protein